MRRFHSYGSIDTEEHYYAPRQELIEKAYTQLIGYNHQKGGHPSEFYNKGYTFCLFDS